MNLGPIVQDPAVSSFRHMSLSRPVIPLRRRVPKPLLSLATISEVPEADEPLTEPPQRVDSTAVEACARRLTDMNISDKSNELPISVAASPEMILSPTMQLFGMSNAEPYMLALVS